MLLDPKPVEPSNKESVRKVERAVESLALQEFASLPSSDGGAQPISQVHSTRLAPSHIGAPKEDERRLQGRAIASGISIGPAYTPAPNHQIVQESAQVLSDTRPGRAAFKVEQEITRFRSALDQSRYDVQLVQDQMLQEGVREGAEILDAHLMMLRDPMITDYIEDQVRRTEQSLEHVIRGFIQDCERKFSRIADDAFRMRLQDIQDVINRILGHLSFPSSDGASQVVPEGAVLFLHEATPSVVAEAQRFQHTAFVTERGGETSHAGIIARAKGIPFVSHIDFSLHPVHPGETVIVDGYTGVVILSPSQQTLALYTQRTEELKQAFQELDAQRLLPALTTDGHRIRISGNIKLAEEISKLEERGCEGIGLYRSELLFEGMTTSFPSEEAQFHAYCQAARATRGQPAIIRVFDIGGDKPFGYSIDRSLSLEQNPFLGCRGLRFLLKHTPILHTQLRALWRAALYGPIKILVPMVTTVQELVELRRRVHLARHELQQEGLLLPAHLEVGAMIEVPSAALLAEEFAEVCDFFSIGTNDLVQYTLAVERGNPSLSHLFSALDPAVLRLIQKVCRAATQRGIEVGICGELGSDPRATPLLIGLGVDELAVSPRQLPVIKHVVRSFSNQEALDLTEEIMALSQATLVRARLEEFLQLHCPIAALLS
jgi:phosphoenolpyruvate-protein phosphotransferase (PTS system enzyme I)